MKMMWFIGTFQMFIYTFVLLDLMLTIRFRRDQQKTTETWMINFKSSQVNLNEFSWCCDIFWIPSVIWTYSWVTLLISLIKRSASWQQYITCYHFSSNALLGIQSKKSQFSNYFWVVTITEDALIIKYLIFVFFFVNFCTILFEIAENYFFKNCVFFYNSLHKFVNFLLIFII